MSIIAIPSGAGWVDDFDGVAIDPTKWWRDTGHDHPHGQPSGMSMYGEFSDEADLYSVSGSVLSLYSKFVSGTWWYQSIISTRGLFTPTHGIWRAALRWDRGHALTGGWWMNDPNDQYNEIDPAEYFPEPATPRKYSTNLDMHSWGSGSLWMTAPVDSDTTFHVYEVEITDKEIIYRRDYVETGRRPAPYSMPAVYCLLSTQVGIGGTIPQVPDGTTPLNPKFDIDWVGWWPNPVRPAGPYATGLDF